MSVRDVPVGRSVFAAAMSEDHLLSNVVDLARLQGWLIHHCRPAHTAKGWRTPITGTPGFPDLVLARPPRLILAELKSMSGGVHRLQRVWLVALHGIPGVETHVWRPKHWLDGTIAETLRRLS